MRLVQPDLPAAEALALIEFFQRCSDPESMRCVMVLFRHEAEAVSSVAKRVLVSLQA